MGKSLHEGTIDPVVGHPLEVTDHGLSVVRAEGLGRCSVCVGEGGGVEFIVIVFRHIRPKVNRNIARTERLIPVPCPVRPAEIGSVALTIEPALIAGHYFACQRVRIYAGYGGTVIGLEHSFLRFRECCLQDGEADKRQDNGTVRDFHVVFT
ncbi:MAG: hypothetical protein ISS76_20080 [Phycisphaerae bacterium]|nr:hypothetical protein [Phycisphaerae bacterium]